jgi:hypothetical protein
MLVGGIYISFLGIEDAAIDPLRAEKSFKITSSLIPTKHFHGLI